MALTIRERQPRKRNIASLVGGVVIAVGCFVLWILVLVQLTQWPPNMLLISLGMALALLIGCWIRLADL